MINENVEVIYENFVLVFVYFCDLIYFSWSNVSENSLGSLGFNARIFKTLTIKDSKYSNTITPIIIKK